MCGSTLQCQSRGNSFFRCSSAEEETPWQRVQLGWGEQPADSAVPQAALPAVSHLGAVADPGKTSPQSVLSIEAEPHAVALGPCAGPVSWGSFLLPWALWFSPEPEAAAGGSCCPWQLVPSAGISDISRGWSGLQNGGGYPSHHLARLRYTKHGLETSASLWTMGITDKVKFTLMFSSLKHSHWHQWHVFCRPGHGWAAHAPWYFQAGWTCPLGCCSHTSLGLCTSAVYVWIAPRVWCCHRAGPSFVCLRSWLQAVLYSHRQNVWFRDCSEVFSHSETSVSSCCSALVFTSFSEPKPPA